MENIAGAKVNAPMPASSRAKENSVTNGTQKVEGRDSRTVFSVRDGLNGVKVLIVHDFDGGYPSSGEWRDARSRDLPIFFHYLKNGRKV